jgi:hypothetical protein
MKTLGDAPKTMDAVWRLVKDKASRGASDEGGGLERALDEDVEDPVVDGRVEDAQTPGLAAGVSVGNYN